ncbi:hypothetical protein DC345_14710 [Paenibacillus taichungensis]|uniref:Uncharacterized protein n=1 Tax=Paenibacillus taichungensis TaxID=484184 RepID=A0A329QSA5_9BACL|nr:hypothetical protein [Paenibacillus taichungensis]RAW15264.1 hypothetical protein DC345_14710 [Paenibacillus taichungensis]
MEFEFHITVNDLTFEEKESFIEQCQVEQVKPVMIVLDQGEYIHQPMITGLIHSTDFDEVNSIIKQMVTRYQGNGFTVVRTKVEVPAKEEKYFHQRIVAHSTPYFEWHGKVQVDDVERLKELCEGDGGHISRNSLNANGKIRFVTVREYNSSEKFYSRVEKIHNILQQNKIELIKQQYELCIYDSWEELDRGWI